MIVHRSDGSGTTNAFTDLPRHRQRRLAQRRRRGQGSQLADRQRRAGQRRRRRAASSRPTARIGYVELQYAVVSGLASAAVKNANGKFVQARRRRHRRRRGRARGTSRPTSGPARSSTAPGDTTYPIAAYTYLLVYVDQTDADQGPGPRGLHLLGPDRRPEGREGDRLRAAAGRGPAEGARRAPHRSPTGGSPIWP